MLRLVSGCGIDNVPKLTTVSTPPTARAGYPSDDVTAQWVPIVIKKREVTKVGTFILPLPIVIPDGVSEPYKMALLPVMGKPRIYSVVLYWPPASELSMRKWATHMGRTLPLPKGAYSTKKPAAVLDKPKLKVWSSWNVGHSKTVAVVMFIQGAKNSTFGRPRRFSMPGSPIRNDVRYVEMQVSYNDENFFEKNEKSGR